MKAELIDEALSNSPSEDKFKRGFFWDYVWTCLDREGHPLSYTDMLTGAPYSISYLCQRVHSVVRGPDNWGSEKKGIYHIL